MFWGFSEALDLVAEYNRHVLGAAPNRDDADPPAELNILLFGAADPRHILCTLAALQIAANGAAPPPPRIRIYMLDGCLEIVARQVLLLGLAFEPPGELSLRARTHIFLDLYGNALLRPASHQYLCSKGRVLAGCITDLDGRAARLMPAIDFGGLRYRERDALLGIFQFWQNSAANRFEAAEYWAQRLRADLGARYDHRAGAFDWDLQMRLRDNGVRRVCPQEYRHWRETGVAFAWPEFEQTVPNKTLAADVHAVGGGHTATVAFRHRGYVGDIHAGPYAAFGERCAEAEMLAADHGTNRYRATDIAERNVLGLMCELQTGERYVHDVRRDSRQMGASVLQLGKHMDAGAAVLDDIVREVREFEQPMLAVGGADAVRVTVLSRDDVMRVAQRERLLGQMDVVFVGHNYFGLLDADFGKVLRPSGALCVFETKQNLVLRKEAIGEFVGKVRRFASDQRLRPVTRFNLNVPMPLVRFVRSGVAEGEEKR